MVEVYRNRRHAGIAVGSLLRSSLPKSIPASTHSQACRGRFEGSQRKTSGDRGELVAGAHSRLGEARLEDAAYGGHEAGSAGQEDSVHLVRGDVAAFEQVVDTSLDGLQLLGDPAFEGGAAHSRFNVHAAVEELKLGGFVVRE